MKCFHCTEPAIEGRYRCAKHQHEMDVREAEYRAREEKRKAAAARKAANPAKKSKSPKYNRIRREYIERMGLGF